MYYNFNSNLHFNRCFWNKIGEYDYLNGGENNWIVH